MTTITALPTAPDRSDPTTFSDRGDALLGALATFVSETNTVAGEVNANAATATTQAGLATTNGAAQVALATAQAVSANVSALAAAASATVAGAAAWLSGTTYAIGDARYSLIDLKTYRRLTAGAGTTDPASDTTNWVCVSSLPTPIGTIMPIINVAENPYTVGDQVWLKTGSVAARATYPNGPGCVTAQGAINQPLPIGGTPYISYANGMFIVATSNAVWTSADGLTWAYYGTPANADNKLSYCAYGSGKYVFQTSDSTAFVLTTTDFVTYTSVALPNTGVASAGCNSISFTNSLFVYVCSNSSVAYLYTSTDGTTWTQRTLPNSATYRGAAYGNSRWFVTCSGTSWHGAYSTDGVTWTAVAYSTYQCASSPIYANGIFICYGSGGQAMTSATGTASFTANALPGTPAATSQSLTWTGAQFLANGASGALYASTSGTGSWTQLTTVGLVSTNLSGPVSNGSGTVLATTAGSAPIYVSTDTMASVWGINRITNSTALGAVPCGDATTAIAVQATTSTDITYIVKRSGINFRTKQITSGVALTGANVASAWNGSVYVTTRGAASTAGRSSPDGVTWTSRTFSRAIQSDVKTLAALTTNGRFVGVCGSTTGTTCTDGATWVDTSAFPVAFYYICTNGSTLIALPAGDTNSYYTSTDGVSWTARTFPSNFILTAGSLYSDRTSTFATNLKTQSNGLYAAYFSTDGITWTLRYIPTGGGAAMASSCASGIWTDRGVTFDAGVTWYINSTIAGLPASTAHNCMSMSIASTAATTIDASTLLTGVDAAIVSNIFGSSTAPAIPNFVRVS